MAVFALCMVNMLCVSERDDDILFNREMNIEEKAAGKWQKQLGSLLFARGYREWGLERMPCKTSHCVRRKMHVDFQIKAEV